MAARSKLLPALVWTAPCCLIAISFFRWVASFAYVNPGVQGGEIAKTIGGGDTSGGNPVARRNLIAAFTAASLGIAHGDVAQAGFFDDDDLDASDRYGAIEPDGITTMLQALEIGSTDIFTDAGSGNGNVVMQVYDKTLAKKVRGIEFVKIRHDRAAKNLAEYKDYKKGLDPNRDLSLIYGDICKADFSDSTIVLASSVCYSRKVMECLKAACEPNANLRYLVTSIPLPGNTNMTYIGDVKEVETTWTGDTARYRVYTNIPGTELPKSSITEPADGKSPYRVVEGDVICR